MCLCIRRNLYTVSLHPRYQGNGVSLYHVGVVSCLIQLYMFAFFVPREEDRARELAEGKLNWLKRQASWTVNLPSASVFSSVQWG